MIQLKTILDVADNTGARKASLIGVLKAKGKMWAKVGDIVRVNVKESTRMPWLKKAVWPRVLSFVPRNLSAVKTGHMSVSIQTRWSSLMTRVIPRAHASSGPWRASYATWTT